MIFHVITLFPDMVKQAMSHGVIGRALQRKLIELHCHNPRDFAENRHNNVDDRPYGGGPGMVMMYDPLWRTLQHVQQSGTHEHLICLSPQGRRLDQTGVKRLAQRSSMTLLCGRYEGIDQRFIDRHVDEELSLGDFVISGGELAAGAVMDAVTRLLPGVLGDEDSARDDSFMHARLGCPQYTRSELLGDSGVPEVLLSGHHQAIEAWRTQEAMRLTKLKRPDLLAGTSEDNQASRSQRNTENETKP